MRAPPVQAPFDEQGQPSKAWIDWAFEAFLTLKKDKGVNTTANRPTNGLEAGDYYFDTTLGQPIWYDGSGWVDATGTTA